MKLEKLIAHFGTQVAAAHAIGVTQPTISNWRTRGHIPHLQQLRIEYITGGKLKADPKILKSKSITGVK